MEMDAEMEAEMEIEIELEKERDIMVEMEMELEREMEVEREMEREMELGGGNGEGGGYVCWWQLQMRSESDGLSHGDCAQLGQAVAQPYERVFNRVFVAADDGECFAED